MYKFGGSLGDLGIKPKYTAIRNPCTNLAERVNRQLGNIFRVMVGHHTKWVKYVKIIEKCINETYYDTIEMTPYQAQWGTKSKRVWESYVDHELMKEEMKNRHNELYQKIKRKGEQRAWKKNEESNKLKFKVGD